MEQRSAASLSRSGRTGAAGGTWTAARIVRDRVAAALSRAGCDHSVSRRFDVLPGFRVARQCLLPREGVVLAPRPPRPGPTHPSGSKRVAAEPPGRGGPSPGINGPARGCGRPPSAHCAAAVCNDSSRCCGGGGGGGLLRTATSLQPNWVPVAHGARAVARAAVSRTEAGPRKRACLSHADPSLFPCWEANRTLLGLFSTAPRQYPRPDMESAMDRILRMQDTIMVARRGHTGNDNT